jgi:hypothetical protein
LLLLLLLLWELSGISQASPHVEPSARALHCNMTVFCIPVCLHARMLARLHTCYYLSKVD